jgi:dGTPase
VVQAALLQGPAPATREVVERREREALAPYAARSGDSRGRQHPESEHAYRTAFQRDRDRVIHSTAFRRLQYKTQVFINDEGDHYRTRMSHSMETAQIARTIARALSLNEDLAECLALAHDIGHTPFGHSGGEALAECMGGQGGFEHNLQALRIVELLETPYPQFRGLNLTWETRESMRKHTVLPQYPVEEAYGPALAPLLEAQVVDYSDSIAYDAHDIDDAVRAELIEPASLEALELWRRTEPAARGGPRARVRALIDLEVTDLIEQTIRTLAQEKVRSVDDVRAARRALVGFSPEVHRGRLQVAEFLRRNVYRHHRVLQMQQKARRFVSELFKTYVAQVDLLPPRFVRWAQEVGAPRSVADYIAGMTDRYAQEQYRKLFHPFENLL